MSKKRINDLFCSVIQRPSYDSLTDVLDRQTMYKYINILISKNIPFSFCLIDIDNFKYINDGYGHIVGDKVISDVAKSLNDFVLEDGVVGRYGGDEFLVIFDNLVEYDNIWSKCRMIETNIAKTYSNKNDMLDITVTIGVSRFPLDGADPTDILYKADKALYRGKAKGRNCFVIYLDSKHKNLDYSENLTVQDPIALTLDVYKYMTKNESYAKNLKDLFIYISKNTMFDHICIQDKDEVFLSTIHKLSKSKNIKPVSLEQLDGQMNEEGIFKRNSIEDTQEDGLDKIIDVETIGACLYCKIEAFGQYYGIVRIERFESGRIFQRTDIALIVSIAKILGTILYYNKKTIKELFG